MKSRFLKRFRVFFSVITLLILSLIFLDFRKIISSSFYSYITYFQFIPSLLKFIDSFLLISSGFIIVIILTLIFGRIYCSFLCPLGVLQDVFIYIRRLFNKRRKNKFHFSKPLNWLRYSLLILVLVLFIIHNVFLLAWIDPYSIFGRTVTLYFKPVLILLNNSIAEILNNANNYFLYKVPLIMPDITIYFIPTITLILILWMTFKHGRLFCNSICPVGAILGIISKKSLIRININRDACNSCHLCERECKAECIDIENQIVDSSRCVACFNCIGICKSSGINYNFNIGNNPKSSEHDKAVNVQNKLSAETSYNNRRFFLKNSLTYISGFLLINKIKANESNSPAPINRLNPVTPPGSLSIEHFTLHCTACQLCVNVCPTKVLQPSYLQYGITGIMQPTMYFNIALCNYDCTKCSEVCPTGAIKKLSIEEKLIEQTGIAKFLKNNCVVTNMHKDCGACAEHCPTKACHMVPYKDDLVIPEVTENLCIGCGACEYACPAKPYKAIYVEGNKVHQKAQKPIEKEFEPKQNKEDFPF